jgi:hypothetical protein
MRSAVGEVFATRTSLATYSFHTTFVFVNWGVLCVGNVVSNIEIFGGAIGMNNSFFRMPSFPHLFIRRETRDRQHHRDIESTAYKNIIVMHTFFVLLE